MPCDTELRVIGAGPAGLAAAALLLLSAALDPGLKRAAHRARTADLLPACLAAGIGLLLLPTPLTTRFFAAALWFWGLDRVRAARGGPASASLSPVRAGAARA